jgi:hypothetical protein
MKLATWGATDILANMTKDFSTASGMEFQVGDFKEVPDGVSAIVEEPDGFRFKVTVEVLGK